MWHYEKCVFFFGSFQSLWWCDVRTIEAKERLEKCDQIQSYCWDRCSKGTLRHQRKVINLLHCAAKLRMSAIFCECLWVVHHHCDLFDFITTRLTNIFCKTVTNLGHARMYHNCTPPSYRLRDGVLKPNDHRRGENDPHSFVGNSVNSITSIVYAISS